MTDISGPVEPSQPIRKLASDEDRQRVTNELSAALGRGQLDFAEFDERSTAAWACRYRDELIPLVADVHDDPQVLAGLKPPKPAYPTAAIPAPFEGHSPAGSPSPVRGLLSPRQAVDLVRSRITGESTGSGLSASVMGGAVRNGDWLVPRIHTTITVMGGNDIDLREARFESGEIEIRAFALMGGIGITVPEGVRVICDGFALMGGFDAAIDKKATIRPADLPPDAPVVRVTGFALMGGIGVITKPRGE
ncbi:DUF1707 SHOCT-like domain-containing protein [Corynebacterium sp. A21]|uniref:DUF1707 SHOCT-like domain-containing protein n=1 Tax=Corynebacterium sp. A21 TaxID=3457318 RepID=UPI003FD60283